MKSDLAREVAALEAQVKARHGALMRSMRAFLKGDFGARIPRQVTTFMQAGDDPASILKPEGRHRSTRHTMARLAEALGASPTPKQAAGSPRLPSKPT